MRELLGDDAPASGGDEPGCRNELINGEVPPGVQRIGENGPRDLAYPRAAGNRWAFRYIAVRLAVVSGTRVSVCPGAVR